MHSVLGTGTLIRRRKRKETEKHVTKWKGDVQSQRPEEGEDDDELYVGDGIV